MIYDSSQTEGKLAFPEQEVEPQQFGKKVAQSPRQQHPWLA